MRENLIAGKRLASEAELAARVAKILKHEISEAQVIAAYSEMLELERPGGPLCIFAKEAPRPVTASDRAKAVAKAHSYKERQVAEAEAKRESEAKDCDELIPELDMGKPDEAPVKKPTPDGYQIKTPALAASSAALLSAIEGLQDDTMDRREAKRIGKGADAAVRKVAADLKRRLDRSGHEVRA